MHEVVHSQADVESTNTDLETCKISTDVLLYFVRFPDFMLWLKHIVIKFSKARYNGSHKTDNLSAWDFVLLSEQYIDHGFYTIDSRYWGELT